MTHAGVTQAGVKWYARGPVAVASAVSAIYAALLLLHAPWLRLPYFWDEAGYYIPAAHDLFLNGWLIPQSTISTSHPPLPQLYLAACWKLFGYSPLVTRAAMLLVAALGIFGVYRLGRRLTSRQVAAGAAAITAVYPVVFAQSSLAHADMMAFALTLWGLELYFSDQPPGGDKLHFAEEPPGGVRLWRAAAVFALAALAKETAIVTPAALAVFEMCGPEMSGAKLGGAPLQAGLRWRGRIRRALWLLAPALPLAAWLFYLWARTGSFIGSPEFVRYNVGATAHPLRILLALPLRLWQVLGYMGLWSLTALAAAAMRMPPLFDEALGAERPRIALRAQLAMAAVVAAHIVLHSIIGGAVLARYMMVTAPLVALISVSTLWRRVAAWPWALATVAVIMISGWFLNPPYRFAPEDNLNYVDHVRLHQQAAALVEQRYAHARVLTAWPASDELTKPYLGYVKQPLAVVRVENFTAEQMAAAQSASYDLALVFSTKYEPPQRLRWALWERLTERYFDYHRDLPPQAIAGILHGQVVMLASRNGQWVALISFERDFVAQKLASLQAGDGARVEVRPAGARGGKHPGTSSP